MPLCFAIMPITTPADAVSQYGGDREHFTHVADFLFKPAAELAGYRFVPASVDSSKVIQAAIIQNLAHADVVLCDTSLWNANVFFELGMRVALNKPVALVRDRLTESIPFDNTPVHCYEYDHRMDPWCLEEEIPKLSRHIAAAGKHQQNELWKFAGIQVTAQQSDAGNPEDAKLDLLLAEIVAVRKRTDQIQRSFGLNPRSSLNPRSAPPIDLEAALPDLLASLAAISADANAPFSVDGSSDATTVRIVTNSSSPDLKNLPIGSIIDSIRMHIQSVINVEFINAEGEVLGNIKVQ